MKLYENAQEMNVLYSFAEEDGLDELTTETIFDTLEGLEMEFNDKVENICFVVKNILAEADAISAELERLNKRKKARINRVDSLKRYLKVCMDAAETKKAGGKLFTATVRKAGGKLPLIVDVDPEELPTSLQKVTVSADTDAIRNYIDSGAECEFAHYGERGESLVIR